MKHEVFALQVNESTNITGQAHFHVIARFIENQAIVKDFLCCKESPETTKAKDVFDVCSIID